MKIITPGHLYELASYEGAEPQRIQFIEKGLREGGDVAARQDFVTINDGTTNEELLAVLIDRMNFLNTKAPCRQNALAITKLQEAGFWLRDRTEEREARGVIGTPQK